MPSSTVVLLLLCGLARPPLLIPQSQAGAQQTFSQRTDAERIQELASMLRPDLSISTYTIETILLGLSDANPDVREAACNVIAARGFAARFNTSDPQAVDRWSAERPALLPLRTRLLAIVQTDDSMHVRIAAIVASLNLEYAGGEANNGMLIGESVATAFVAAYESDPPARVRAELMKSLARTDAPVDYSTTLLKGLEDPSDDVVLQALHGVGRRQLARAVPVVVRLLDSPRTDLRRAAALSLAAIGRAAAGAVSALEKAIAAESDAGTRAQMVAALSRIRSQ